MRADETFTARYQRLQSVRERWCSSHPQPSDRSGITIELDGATIHDIPSLWLQLGEAVNGPGGYYGGDLDAFADCLCGGFGLTPPFTLRVINTAHALRALDHEAWRAWHTARHELVRNNKRYRNEKGAALHVAPAFHTPQPPTYFDALVTVLVERGVTLNLDDTP